MPSSFRNIRRLFFAWCILVSLAAASGPAEAELVIGVLAKRGIERCLDQWTPTADYLTRAVPGRTFRIQPLEFEDVIPFVEKRAVDLILVNSSLYVILESRFGVTRITTMKNRHAFGSFTRFGSVIFARKESRDIRELRDLKGKRFLAVKESSFGGWQMAWRELKTAGINPFEAFSSLAFAGTHDAVVFGVLDRRADAGCVRTDTLERMYQEGKIRLDQIRVIQGPGFKSGSLPFLNSTRTYPEWPMAKAAHMPDFLAEKITTALLEMDPNSPAAISGAVDGWTIPANYQPVHDCLRELKIGPYENLGKFSLADVARKYWHLLVSFSCLVLVLSVSILVFIRLNREIKSANETLSKEMAQREILMTHLQEKNIELEAALSEIRTLRGILPICAHCKKIRDDKGYWKQLEVYLHEHSHAEFSHGICRECAKKYYPGIDIYED